MSNMLRLSAFPSASSCVEQAFLVNLCKQSKAQMDISPPFKATIRQFLHRNDEALQKRNKTSPRWMYKSKHMQTSRPETRSANTILGSTRRLCCEAEPYYQLACYHYELVASNINHVCIHRKMWGRHFHCTQHISTPIIKASYNTRISTTSNTSSNQVLDRKSINDESMPRLHRIFMLDNMYKCIEVEELGTDGLGPICPGGLGLLDICENKHAIGRNR